MKLEEPQVGLLSVRYGEADDLKVDRQQPLLARLEERRGPVVIIYEVADGLRSVPMEVPTFWLGVTSRLELGLVGMAIVTHSSAVRVAARGFALANVARGIPTAVQTFESVEAATTWAASLLIAR